LGLSAFVFGFHCGEGAGRTHQPFFGGCGIGGVFRDAATIRTRRNEVWGSPSPDVQRAATELSSNIHLVLVIPDSNDGSSEGFLNGRWPKDTSYR
jgi:hypothetical protein